MLSSSTIDHLLEAESHLRAALKSAASNEKPTVIHLISKLISELDSIKRFEDLMDMLDKVERPKK